MRISRRKFLQAAAATGALTAVRLSLPFKWGVRTAYAFSQSPGLKKFGPGQTLRGVADIGVAASDGVSTVTGATHYTIDIKQYTDQLHPDLLPTTLRGYQPTTFLVGGPAQRHLGGLIVANRGSPVQITFRNKLAGTHPIPIDRTIMGADLGDNRADTHLHGGLVPWVSDGGPHAWFDPAGTTGQSIGSLFHSFYQVLNPALLPGELEYYYPTDQSARLEWYHDHTWGITRMNAYAGIATGYLIRDAFEAGLVGQGLPAFVEAGGNEIPIVIQDKIFVGPNTAAMDPTWPGTYGLGALWYAHVYEPNLYQRVGRPQGARTPPDPSVVPEFFGDTMLANGTVYPVATVEARRYRLRILNACNARFLNIQLYVADGTGDKITLNPANNTPTNAPGPNFLQIGAEGGLLPTPVVVPTNAPFNPLTLAGSLIMGPAERADLIVDFSGFEGQEIVMYNDAPAPFPMGSPLNDYFPGNPGNPTQPVPGFGPNTRQIMLFKVVHAKGRPDAPLTISEATDLRPGNDPLLVPLGDTTVPAGVPTRQLTLNEAFDGYGRLIQLEGTNKPLAYMGPATEVVTNGSTEVWEIYNLTGDTHPIHFHLVNVQIISRQPFKADPSGMRFVGPARPPEFNERGWKETVRMHPGEVTRVIMKFTSPTTIPGVGAVPASPRTGGSEYVWHCHILEHEEHDMMRPLIVG